MSPLITVLKQFNSSVSKRLLYSLNALTVRGQANKESHSSLLVNIASFVQNFGLAINICLVKKDFKTVFFGKQTLINYKQVYLLSEVIISVYKFSLCILVSKLWHEFPTVFAMATEQPEPLLEIPFNHLALHIDQDTLTP